MDKHAQTAAWAIKQALTEVESIHATREALCRAGNVLRTTDGRRYYWVDQKPSDEAREAAKAALVSEPPFRSYCPCCKQGFTRMASVFLDVQEHGVCSYCLPFIEGRLDGVVASRLPTLEEALAVPEHDILHFEAVVLHRALKEA